MSANHITEILVDLLYDELPPDQKRRALQHLDQCPLCAREFEELKATRGAFTNLDDPEPPALLNARIMARAREPRKTKSPIALLMRPAYAMAAVAVLALTVGVFTVINRHGSGEKLEVAMATAPEKSAPGKPAARSRGQSSDMLGLTALHDAYSDENQVDWVMSAGTVVGGIEGTTTAPGGTPMIALLEGGAAQPGSTVAPGSTAMVAMAGNESGSTAGVLAGATAGAGATVVTLAMAPPPPSLDEARVAPDMVLEGDKGIAPVTQPAPSASAPSEPSRGFEEVEAETAKRKEEKTLSWLDNQPEPAPSAPTPEEAPAAAEPPDYEALEAPAPAAKKDEADDKTPPAVASAGATLGGSGPAEREVSAKAARSVSPSPAPVSAPSGGAAPRPAPQPKPAETAKPQAVSPEFADLVTRAERTQRTFGNRAALPVFERALAMAGYTQPAEGDPIPPPGKCSPELERAIKGALDCYYKLGRAQDAIPLEKWKAATCAGK